MEYRSLFDTDTDTLLNDLSNTTNQNQPQTTTTTTTTATTNQTNDTQQSQNIYQSSQAYQTAQGMYHTQSMMPPLSSAHHHQMNYMTQQQQQQNPYYSNQQMMSQIKNQAYSNMHSMPHNGQQQQQQTQPPPPPLPGQPPGQSQQNIPQNGTQNSTTVQNVQINVQNNFNIGKNIQQTSMNQFTQSSNLPTTPTSNPTPQTPWSQYPGQQSQSVYTKQSGIIPQQQNNFNKMNQFNPNLKPSPPPSQPPSSTQSQLSNVNQVPGIPQNLQANIIPPNNSNYQMSQYNQNMKIMTHSTQGQNYPMQMAYGNPQQQQQQPPQQQQQQAPKISSLPPHMQQQQYNPQVYNQNTNNTQQRAPNQMIPNQYQPSPNKLTPNMYPQTNQPQQQPQSQQQQQQQQTSPNNLNQNNNFYSNKTQGYNAYYANNYANPSSYQSVMNTPTRMPTQATYPNYPNQNPTNQISVQNTPEIDASCKSSINNNSSASSPTNTDSPKGGELTPTKRGRAKSKSKNVNSDNNNSPSPNNIVNEDENQKPKKRNSKSKLNSSLDKGDSMSVGSPSLPNQTQPNNNNYVQQQPSRPPSQQPYQYNNPSQSPSAINRVPMPPNTMTLNQQTNMYPNQNMNLYQKPSGYMTTQMTPQMTPMNQTPQIQNVMPNQPPSQVNQMMPHVTVPINTYPSVPPVYNPNNYTPIVNGSQYPTPPLPPPPPPQPLPQTQTQIQPTTLPPQQQQQPVIKPQIPVQNIPVMNNNQTTTNQNVTMYPIQSIPIQKPVDIYPPVNQVNGYSIPIQNGQEINTQSQQQQQQQISQIPSQISNNQQQQEIRPNFYLQNESNHESIKKSPNKKTTNNEKKVRKIKPKKDGCDSNDTSINNNDDTQATQDGLSASTQSKIDATIDDFMKKYNMKSLSDSESDDGKSDDGDDKKDSDFKEDINSANSDTNNNASKLEGKKGKKGRGGGGRKKKNLDLIGLSHDDGETADDGETKKKRKYTKKKINKLNLPDDLSQSNLDGSDSLTVQQMVNEEDDNTQGDDSGKKIKKKESSFVVSGTRGRRRSAFVKLMQKNKRKKRKKTSSDEDGVSDDDSDDFELTPAVASRAKKEEISSNQEETNGIPEGDLQSDEATAKLLQANEKRRSTRCIKRQKYADSAIKDEDLLMPVNDSELADEDQPQEKKGNIEFSNGDNLIVDKILGIRLNKRKTRRKIEKKKIIEDKKENIVEASEVKTEDKIEEKMDIENPGEENKENKLDDDKKETVETMNEKNEKTETPPETIAATVEPPNEQEDQQEDVSEYETDGEIEVEEFYVKYKNLSYLHCEWRTRDEIFYSDKRIDQKIKRYRLKKQQSQIMDWDEQESNPNGYNNDYDELYNPDYIVIDRILDETEVDDLQRPGEKIRYFLVKWKALAYDESSWELESDVKNLKKIERFRHINTLNPDVHLKVVARPKPDKWNRMTESRVYKNNNRIREYQLEGINWLTFCWLNDRNCILADEMGLGKTIQSITFLQELAFYGVRGPFLVLVPLSTIGNWIREFETWTDFNVIVYHGSTVSRQMLQDYEFYFKDKENSKKKIVKFDALVTTYEVLMSDVPLFCSFKWRNLIIDEAHRLKNKNCRLVEGLKCMDIEHKVLLTGTPLQNNVEELFSLLNFLEPQQFHSSVEFMQEFGDLKTDTQVQKLQAVLKPMMLRRLKEDVEKNLKPKEETIVEVELTNTQKKYYRAILERNFQFLARGASGSNVPNLMNTMMELRKCCNHPYLIDGAEDQIVAEYVEQQKTENHENSSLKAMIHASGKLVLVDKLLPKLKAGGHRVLIFSQMIRVLDILEDYLIQMRFTYERLDGRIRGEARQEAIDRYSKPDSDRFAFLLCTRAGGLGINLTAADTVIIYDSDWNPQNDLQAQARVHRIGQQKSVKIYRLITRNTYEREMFDKASLKLGLDKAILQSMRNEDKFNASANVNSQLSKKEIEDLLKKGAYGAIMEDDTAADKFCEEDIDKILQQRSTVIQIEGGEKGSTFSKASFQTSETNDISIDDPEFWQKWAKKAEIDIEEKLNPKDERIIYEPRRRTQTRRYGGPDDLMEESDSDSSSSSDENKDQNKKDKGKKKKRGRPTGDDAAYNDGDDDDDSNVWSREECYKVEKLLLIYGWSRWAKILSNLELSSKRRGAQVQTEQDVENLSRTIIAYTLKNYTGDECIKQFILELIDPSKSDFADLKNHHGLAAPVARGRRPRPPQQENQELEKSEADMEWAKNAEELLGDENYKKHLNKQANKILLRLRMLFYIKSEIIGEEYSSRLDQDDSDVTYENVDLALPDVQFDLPADWWDKSCDNSIVLGVYKHGFEKYNQIRSDPKLVFLTLCGPPDDKDLLAEQQQNENDENNDMDADDQEVKPKEESVNSQSGKYKKFPTVSELNNRLRRLIATVQKYKKQEQLMSKRNAERQEKRLSKMAVNQERAQAKQIEKQSKWSRREEQNFYKTITAFGVDCLDKDNLIFAWDKFRELGQLDKKLDDTLTDYYLSFVFMCKRICNKITDEDSAPVIEVPVELITEERAARCLHRIDMMNKIRLEILKNENFDEIMNKCTGSLDLPDWYVPVKHDKELVKAAARHGLTRTEYYYYNDQEFSFRNDLTLYTKYIEKLMDEENENLDHESRILDPIQYYFQNQGKIQLSFKTSREVKPEKKEEKIVEKLEKKSSEIECDVKKEEEVKDVENEEQDKSLIDTSQKELVIDETESPVKKLEKSECDMEVDKPKTPSDEVSMKEELKEEEDEKIEEVKETKKEEVIDEKNKELIKTESEDKKEIKEDKEPTAYFQPGVVPMILWPKDRVILNRLENIITLFETGEWPQQKIFPNGLLPSASNSQLSIANPLSITNLVQSPNMFMNDNCSVDDDDDNMSHDNDPEYYSGKGNAKPKRGRPPKYEQFGGMKNLDSIDENMMSNKFLEPGEILRPKTSRSKTQLDSENSDASSSSSSTKLTKKNRKSIHKEPNPNLNQSGLMNPADLAALAALFMAPGQDPDERITVINMEDGTRLSGSKAPKRAELPMWLLSHPNYLPDEQEIINMTLKNSAFAALQNQSINEPVKKMEKLDDRPSRPESTSSTHQSPSTRSKSTPQIPVPQDPTSQLILYNKTSNKRINSAKIPPLKHLASFLEKNEQIFIDSSSNDLIRSKFGGKIPDIIKSRMSSNKPKQVPKTPQVNSAQPSPATTPKPNGLPNKNKPQKPAQNPFSPSNLNDLLGANSGLDLNNLSNNPLAGIMAAALAGQGGTSNPGLPFSNPSSFNPFLLPPFGAGLPNVPGLNPMDFFKDFSKLQPGLDMNSIDEFSAQLAALQNLSNFSGLQSQTTSSQNSPVIKPETKSSSKDSKMLNKPKPEQQKQTEIKKNPHSTSSMSANKEKEIIKDNKPSTPVLKNSIESKLKDTKTPKSESKSEMRSESKLGQKMSKQNEAKMSTNPDFSSLAAAMSQFDPTNPNNLTALASMMEQDKFLKEMMNFSQFNPALANNPFLFSAAGANPFTPPVLPPPPLGSTSKSKNRSPSPNPDRAHSLSPALSASSNLSAAQQQAQMDMTNGMDFNFLMSNLMNFGAGTGANAFPPGLLPPPPFGLPGAGDLSKLPVELLTALSAAAAQPGGGLDPNMFSALAQLNSLSNTVADDKQKSNKTVKPSSSGMSSGLKPGSKSSSNGANKSNSGKSSAMSSNGKKRDHDEQQGLDLSIRRSGSHKPESESNSSKRVRQTDD